MVLLINILYCKESPSWSTKVAVKVELFLSIVVGVNIGLLISGASFCREIDSNIF